LLPVANVTQAGHARPRNGHGGLYNLAPRWPERLAWRGCPARLRSERTGYAPDKLTCLAATLEIGNICRQRKPPGEWPGCCSPWPWLGGIRAVRQASPAAASARCGHRGGRCPAPSKAGLGAHVDRNRVVTCDVRNWQYLLSSMYRADLTSYLLNHSLSPAKRATVTGWERHSGHGRWI
jgi:hypothetical protein